MKASLENPIPSENMQQHKSGTDKEINNPTTTEEANDSPNEDILLEVTDHPSQPAPSFKNILMIFLKQLASATGDLSQLTCPAVLLSGISLLEYSCHWCDHPDLFADISRPSSPPGKTISIWLHGSTLERMLCVAKWYLSYMFGSYGSRAKQDGFEKKPYNPILGEQFMCKWVDSGSGETFMICEQVSHHPPITAFYFENKQANVLLSGQCGQKTKFTGTSVKVDQQGSAILFLRNHNEEYHFQYPELQIRGLLSGTPFIEATGEIIISCTSNYTCSLKFIAKPWFSGEYDGVKGKIYHNEDPKSEIYSIQGHWTSKIFYSDLKSKKADLVLLDIQNTPLVHPLVRPVSEQTPLESRAVWRAVTEALMNKDYDEATKQKMKIEEEQRKLRKERTENNDKWHPKYFKLMHHSYFVDEIKSAPLSPISELSSFAELNIKKKKSKKDKRKHGHEMRWTFQGIEDLTLPSIPK